MFASLRFFTLKNPKKCEAKIGEKSRSLFCKASFRPCSRFASLNTTESVGNQITAPGSHILKGIPYTLRGSSPSSKSSSPRLSKALSGVCILNSLEFRSTFFGIGL